MKKSFEITSESSRAPQQVTGRPQPKGVSTTSAAAAKRIKFEGERLELSKMKAGAGNAKGGAKGGKRKMNNASIDRYQRLKPAELSGVKINQFGPAQMTGSGEGEPLKQERCRTTKAGADGGGVPGVRSHLKNIQKLQNKIQNIRQEQAESARPAAKSSSRHQSKGPRTTQASEATGGPSPLNKGLMTYLRHQSKPKTGSTTTMQMSATQIHELVPTLDILKNNLLLRKNIAIDTNNTNTNSCATPVKYQIVQSPTQQFQWMSPLAQEQEIQKAFRMMTGSQGGGNTTAANSSHGARAGAGTAAATVVGVEGPQIPPPLLHESSKARAAKHGDPPTNLKSSHYLDYVNQQMIMNKVAGQSILKSRHRDHNQSQLNLESGDARPTDSNNSREQFFSRRLKDSLSQERNIKTQQEHRSRDRKLSNPLFLADNQQSFLNNRCSQPIIGARVDTEMMQKPNTHTQNSRVQSSAVADVEAFGPESQTEEKNVHQYPSQHTLKGNPNDDKSSNHHTQSFSNIQSRILRKCQSRTSRMQFGSVVSKNSSQVQFREYDYNGRVKSVPKSNHYDLTGEQKQEAELAQQLIEEKYHALQKSYQKIFKSQQSYRQFMRGQQISGNCELDDSSVNLQQQINSFDGEDNRKASQTQRHGAKSTQQLKLTQQLGDGNNNNSQNNINNSIILVHSGLNSNLDILKGQFNFNMAFNDNDNENIDGNERRSGSQGEGVTFVQQSENNNNQPRREKKRNLSPVTQDEAASSLIDQTDVLSSDLNTHSLGKKRARYDRKSNDNQPRSAQSLSGERVSSCEPNDMDNEEANNQMLMQILYNNLKKKQNFKPKTRRLHKDYKDRSYKRTTDSRAQDPKSCSQSKRSESLLNSQLKHEVSSAVHQPSYHVKPDKRIKEKSPTTSNDSENKVEHRINVQPFVRAKNMGKRDENKKSEQPEVDSGKAPNPHMDIRVTKAPSESLPEADAEWLSSVEAAPLNQGKGGPQAALPQAAGDKYKILETSTKIEKVLKENQLFKEIGKDKIMEAMMQLLNQKQGPAAKSVNKPATQSFGTMVKSAKNRNQKAVEPRNQQIKKQQIQILKQPVVQPVLQTQSFRQKRNTQSQSGVLNTQTTYRTNTQNTYRQTPQNISRSKSNVSFNQSTPVKIEPISLSGEAKTPKSKNAEPIKEVGQATPRLIVVVEPQQASVDIIIKKQVQEDKKPSSGTSGRNRSGDTSKTAQFMGDTFNTPNSTRRNVKIKAENQPQPGRASQEEAEPQARVAKAKKAEQAPAAKNQLVAPSIEVSQLEPKPEQQAIEPFEAHAKTKEMKAKPSTRKAADPPARKETQPEAAALITKKESSEQQVQAPKKRTKEPATRPQAAPAEETPAEPKPQPTPPDDTTSIINIQLTKLNSSIKADDQDEEIADEVQITENIISERILIEDNEKPPTEEKLKSISDEVVNMTPILTAGSNAEDAEELPKAMEEEEAVETVEEDNEERPVLQMEEIQGAVEEEGVLDQPNDSQLFTMQASEKEVYQSQESEHVASQGDELSPEVATELEMITQNSEKESTKQQPTDLEADKSNRSQKSATLKPATSVIHVEAKQKSEMSELLESLAGQYQDVEHCSSRVTAPEFKPISFAPSNYQQESDETNAELTRLHNIGEILTITKKDNRILLRHIQQTGRKFQPSRSTAFQFDDKHFQMTSAFNPFGLRQEVKPESPKNVEQMKQKPKALVELRDYVQQCEEESFGEFNFLSGLNIRTLDAVEQEQPRCLEALKEALHHDAKIRQRELAKVSAGFKEWAAAADAKMTRQAQLPNGVNSQAQTPPSKAPGRADTLKLPTSSQTAQQRAEEAITFQGQVEPTDVDSPKKKLQVTSLRSTKVINNQSTLLKAHPKSLYRDLCRAYAYSHPESSDGSASNSAEGVVKSVLNVFQPPTHIHTHTNGTPMWSASRDIEESSGSVVTEEEESNSDKEESSGSQTPTAGPPAVSPTQLLNTRRRNFVQNHKANRTTNLDDAYRLSALAQSQNENQIQHQHSESSRRKTKSKMSTSHMEMHSNLESKHERDRGESQRQTSQVSHREDRDFQYSVASVGFFETQRTTMTNGISNWSKICFLMPDAQLVEYEHELLMVYRLRNFLQDNIQAAVQESMLRYLAPDKNDSAGITAAPERQIFSIQKRLGKYPEFEKDKANIEKLLRNYQLEIQVKKAQAIQKSLPLINNEGEHAEDSELGSQEEEYSQILASTISSLSRFSCASKDRESSFILDSKESSNSGRHPTGLRNSRERRSYLNQDFNRLDVEDYGQSLYPYQRRGVHALQVPRTLEAKGSLELPASASLNNELGTFDNFRFKQGRLSVLSPGVDVFRRQYSASSLHDRTFFNNPFQDVVPYERIKFDMVNQILESVELKSISVQNPNSHFQNNFEDYETKKISMEKYVKSMWQGNLLGMIDQSALTPDLQGPLTQETLSALQKYSAQTLKQLQRIWYLNTQQSNLSLVFSIDYLIKSAVFCTQDFEEWKTNRLNSIRQDSMKQQSIKLIAQSMNQFWSQNQRLLQKFLTQKEDQADQDDSITSDCEDVANNNQYSIQIMHDGNNPNLLLRRVVKEKNVQYEIFRILSQTKLDKIKNRVKELVQRPDEPLIPPYIDQIEARFAQIKKQMISKSKQYEFQQYLQPVHSSELCVSDSMEQKATYMYVEELQLQQHRRQMRTSVGVLCEGPGQPDNAVKRELVYGNRLGEEVDKLKKCQKRKKWQEENLANFGYVRLTNGMHLSLSDEPNVLAPAQVEELWNKNTQGNDSLMKETLSAQYSVYVEPQAHDGEGSVASGPGQGLRAFCLQHKLTRKQIKVDPAAQIQGYYDQVKEHVQNGAQKDKIIIKYERQQCYGAEDISKAETGKMNVRQGQLQKLLQTKKTNLAVSIDITKQGMKRFVNPFQYTLARPLPHAPTRSEQLQHATKLGRPRRRVKYQTADKFQENGIEDVTVKPVNYKQGSKCKNFSYICKLQSFGDYTQYQALQEEMELENSQYIRDINQYRNSHDAESGFPIYVLFEVIHVLRKTSYDKTMEEQELIQNLKKKQKELLLPIGGDAPTPYLRERPERQPASSMPFHAFGDFTPASPNSPASLRVGDRSLSHQGREQYC